MIVQVVDARDPLFFESSDLSIYVKEVDSRKESVLLLNKADLLTEEQRKTWSKHFLESDTKALFFSATLEEESDGDLNLQEETTEIEFGSSQILRPDQILSVLKNTMQAAETVTVGFTGYPNVGKSSTINRFLTTKKLHVSATPGKTKHFQVIFFFFSILLTTGFYSGTGKSLSEALLFAEHGENILCTKIVLNVRNNFCTQHVLPRFELGLFMY